MILDAGYVLDDNLDGHLKLIIAENVDKKISHTLKAAVSEAVEATGLVDLRNLHKEFEKHKIQQIVRLIQECNIAAWFLPVVPSSIVRHMINS